MARKGPEFGRARVYVDGVQTAEIDLYSAVTCYQQVVFDTGVLEAGRHHVRIEWTGLKNAAATGTSIGIDAFSLTGVEAQVVARREQEPSAVAYTGTWWTWSDPVHSGGSCTYANTAGASVTTTVVGSGFALIAQTGPEFGRARVYVDGIAQDIDLYSTSNRYQQTVLTKTLPCGSHTVRVEWTGTKNPASTGTNVSFDAIDAFSAAPDQTLSFDAANRVVGYTYDTRGNVLTDGTHTFTWDAMNRLTQVKLTSTGAVVASYAYDANGMRQVATIGTTTTRFAVDALTDEIVALIDTTGAVVTRFVRDAAGALVAMVKGGATFTYLTNAHGDVTALVSSAGAIVARWTYDAWGRPTEYNAAGTQVATGTAGNPFLYAGYFYDTQTGHYYLRARYYDPATGCFLSMDPEPGKTTDRLSQNPYIYCQNDPVNLADPDGRMGLWWHILAARRAKSPSGTAKRGVAATGKKTGHRGGGPKSAAAASRGRGGLASSVRKLGAIAMLGAASPLSYPKFLESGAYQRALRYVADGAEGAKYGWEAGLAAHALITADYKAKNLTHDVYGNYFVRGAGRNANFGYADIYDRTTHEVYEIKPESHYLSAELRIAGQAQLTGYINGIRLAGDPKAHAGTLYRGGTVKGFTATVYDDSEGMIYYSGAPKVPVTVPARQPSEQDSRERSTSLKFACQPVYASSESWVTVPAGGSPAWEACTTSSGGPEVGYTFVVAAVIMAAVLAAPAVLSLAPEIAVGVGAYSYVVAH